MSKAKPKAKAAAEPKAYRHTRTNAIRMSIGHLGYPYVPAEEAPKAAEPKATEEEA